MQFDLRKFITAGAKPYHAEFQCDLSAYDYAGARIPQPVTAVFDAQTDGDEVQITLRAKASVHGECARCLDLVAVRLRFKNSGDRLRDPCPGIIMCR